MTVRITSDPSIMGGTPCIAGTRIPVSTVLKVVAEYLSIDAVLAEYPTLNREDVQACLQYGADQASDRILPVRRTA
ncbi:DUF433 domain-containing protein [Gordonia sp. (in: high G+C Gram-positive bacteria)]|mgnify:FL=1|jgi:uncharacterized protein (DUF433 family)|uniref:DUF433 domain-containing protein n=1 Tax=Gordonia sp. (in: high G+C Gram-positive bacteria) TaxID=84139 RepID=UPI002FDB6D88